MMCVLHGGQLVQLVHRKIKVGEFDGEGYFVEFENGDLAVLWYKK